MKFLREFEEKMARLGKERGKGDRLAGEEEKMKRKKEGLEVLRRWKAVEHEADPCRRGASVNRCLGSVRPSNSDRSDFGKGKSVEHECYS